MYNIFIYIIFIGQYNYMYNKTEFIKMLELNDF